MFVPQVLWNKGNPTNSDVPFIVSYDFIPFHTIYLFIIPMGAIHDDVIKWKHFPLYWPFVRGIHRSPVNSPHKGQWRGALMFSLICTRISGWVNNLEAGDLRRRRAHYDVIVMFVIPSVTGIDSTLQQHTYNVSVILYGFLRCIYPYPSGLLYWYMVDHTIGTNMD